MQFQLIGEPPIAVIMGPRAPLSEPITHNEFNTIANGSNGVVVGSLGTNFGVHNIRISGMA